MDRVRPFMPLTCLPQDLLSFLRQNPANAMVPAHIVTAGGGDLLEFYVKANYSEVMFTVDSPRIVGMLGLRYVPNDPDAGEIVLATLELLEADLQQTPGTAGATTVLSADTYYNAAEFPVQNVSMLDQLRRLVEQSDWAFSFIDNDVTVLYNRKRFPNPLSAEDRQRWLQRIEAWRQRCPS